VVVDGDLVTGRSGHHCHVFARKIIRLLAATSKNGGDKRVLESVA
jgi:protease I